MSMRDASNLSVVLDKSHENKWVAFAADYSHILAISDSLAELMRQVVDADAIFYRVLPRDVSFAPAIGGAA